MASSYYPSGFKKAMIISVDGVGDKVSTALGVGIANKIKTFETKGLDQSWVFLSIHDTDFGF